MLGMRYENLINYFLPRTACMKRLAACMILSDLTARMIHSLCKGVSTSSILSGSGAASPKSPSHRFLHAISRPSLDILL